MTRIRFYVSQVICAIYTIRLNQDIPWSKDLETDMIENDEYDNFIAPVYNARISSLFMFYFCCESKMTDSVAFNLSSKIAIYGTILGLAEAAAYFTSDKPGRTLHTFELVLFPILLGVHVLAI